MKTSLIFPMMFILSVGSGLTALAHNGKNMSVEDAIKNKLVTVSIKGVGGYTGDVIAIKMKNLFDHVVTMGVEAGRRLDSQNQKDQDILVNRAVTLSLMPHESKTFLVSGMCCQAHHAGPTNKSEFSIGKMADTNLVKLARYIDLNKWHSNSIAQKAVWVVSDNNPMEDIGGYDPVSKKLQAFITKLTGKEIPKYKVEYEHTEDGGAVYSGVPASIKGTFEYQTYTNGLVTFGIYDAAGHVVQMFFADVPREQGFYIFDYEFKTSNLPSGTYFARFRFDGQVRQEQKFTF